MVGAGRFERPTPCAQGRCATRLRYAPTFYFSDSKPLSRGKQWPLISRLGKTVAKTSDFVLSVNYNQGIGQSAETQISPSRYWKVDSMMSN